MKKIITIFALFCVAHSCVIKPMDMSTRSSLDKQKPEPKKFTFNAPNVSLEDSLKAFGLNEAQEEQSNSSKEENDFSEEESLKKIETNTSAMLEMMRLMVTESKLNKEKQQLQMDEMIKTLQMAVNELSIANNSNSQNKMVFIAQPLVNTSQNSNNQHNKQDECKKNK